MSNEFDKEVADKIAAKIADSETIHEVPNGLVYYKNFEELKNSKDATIKVLDTNFNWNVFYESKKEPEEMNKIDFYRQKVQQYEAVENLMKSIECEIDDAGVARDELYSDYCSKDDVLYHSYSDMIDAYKKCYAILEEVLKDI